MSDTDNTASEAAATDQSGQATQGSETDNQEDVLTRLKEYEQQLAKYTELEKSQKDTEQQAKSAQAEALRWQSSYKSLQANTTASLQEAARVRRQLEEQQRVHDELAQARAEMAQVRAGLEFLASKVVDEDSAREFTLRQRETQLKQMEETAKQRAAAMQQYQQQQVAQPQPYVDPEQQKRQFLDYYFPGAGVDPSDPSIDWGEGAADTREAFRRFTTSVMQIRESKGRSQSEEAPVHTESENLLEQLRKERQELEQARQATLEEVRTQTRRDVEERLRQMGIDAGGSAPATESGRKLSTRLSEIDESRLNEGEPGARKAAAKSMEAELRAIRNQLLNT